jgi:hypothetical protein
MATRSRHTPPSRRCIPFWVANPWLRGVHAARWMGRDAQKVSYDQLIRWPISVVMANAPPSVHWRPQRFKRLPTSCLNVDSMIPEPMTMPLA